MSLKSERVFGLDIIRTAAVMLVLISHLFSPLLPLGVIGVEIFFVLSGYLIGGILHDLFVSKKRFAFSDLKIFWLRRWGRTLPNYFLFLCINFLFFAPQGNEYGFQFYAKYLLFLQNLFWPIPSFFVVSWSLTIEEIFYLCLPFLLISMPAFLGEKKNHYLAACIVLFLIGIITRFVYSDSLSWDEYSRKIAMGRLDALAVGCMLSYGKRHWSKLYSIVANNILLRIFSTIILLWFTFGLFMNDGTQSLPCGNWLFFSFISIIVALLIPYIETLETRTIWIRSCVINISLWSYSIYLSHPVVIFLIKKYYHGEGWINKVTEKSLILIFVMTVSFLLYKFFELPLMRKRPRH